MQQTTTTSPDVNPKSTGSSINEDWVAVWIAATIIALVIAGFRLESFMQAFRQADGNYLGWLISTTPGHFPVSKSQDH